MTPFFQRQQTPHLEAADRCTRPGEIGALMRREGVYSSSLSTWEDWKACTAMEGVSMSANVI
jgi:hypothetical protein